MEPTPPEKPTPADESELYSPVAELYRDHRPRYPSSLIEKSVGRGGLGSGDRILEVGCGPATLTLPMAQRGFRIHGVEPSSGMLRVAKKECRDWANVTFEQSRLETFDAADHSFDAVVAASSFHWAISEATLRKVHRVIRPGGSLILFWNLPPEPNPTVRDAVAKATGRSQPFFFGDASVEGHRQSIGDVVLDRVVDTGRFSKFSHDETETTRRTSPEDYLGFVQTLSPFIRLSEAERTEFLTRALRAMKSLGDSLEVHQTCLLNVAQRLN